MSTESYDVNNLNLRQRTQSQRAWETWWASPWAWWSTWPAGWLGQPAPHMVIQWGYYRPLLNWWLKTKSQSWVPWSQPWWRSGSRSTRACTRPASPTSVCWWPQSCRGPRRTNQQKWTPSTTYRGRVTPGGSQGPTRSGRMMICLTAMCAVIQIMVLVARGIHIIKCINVYKNGNPDKKKYESCFNSLEALVPQNISQILYIKEKLETLFPVNFFLEALWLQKYW